MNFAPRIGIGACFVARHLCAPGGWALPRVFPSTVARRTRRLRYGPLMAHLTLYHQLRVAEEVRALKRAKGRCDPARFPSGGRAEAGARTMAKGSPRR
jgi:alkanesulfonate monooxygenase SsuD/methylene tetrahydromethanopterin reductase-like flavin-dependent oxidoreductase (luciferase family)